MPKENFMPQAKYSLLADPRAIEQIGQPVAEANCRLLVQEALFHIFGLKLPPADCLSEAAYNRFPEEYGEIVWESGDTDQPDPFAAGHPFGTVIFADAKNGVRQNSQYSPEQLRHLAVYLGRADSVEVQTYFGDLVGKNSYPGDVILVLHITSRGVFDGIVLGKVNQPSVWTAEEFQRVYRVRRLVAIDVAKAEASLASRE